ncbi:MAG: type I-E CRISPR-associated protein Cas7/Cse4/CasC [Kytococcus sp.]|nr:type I-E CRISPR-associated protein Cas7/Cse4/CasC [Kytococcus sp.]
MPGTFIDVHVLQTLPPSNVNRDDTGAPKTAFFGGTRRARVSSQAWKRATRAAFADSLDASDLGYRTKRLVELLAPRIEERGGLSADDARARAVAVLEALGLKLEKPRAKQKAAESEDSPVAKSEYLVFLSGHQLDALADVAIQAVDGKVDKKAAVTAADTRHGVDVSLFGRMVADAANLNVDAAVQVAHAISTHAVDNEFDYYTAVDDKNPAEETGAGMIGTIEFNSSTLYRYATLNVSGLRDNLGDEAATAVAAAAFVKGFVCSMPTGKQNTFGNRTLPDAVVVMVRQGQPVSLVGAFEEPVRVDQGFVRGSAERLAAHAESMNRAYDSSPTQSWVVRATDTAAAVDVLGDVTTLDAMVAGVRQAVSVASAPSDA